jgi:hypothetical protein
MYQKVRKCSNRFRKFLKTRYQDVPEGIKNFRKVVESSGIFQNVLENSRKFLKALFLL